MRLLALTIALVVVAPPAAAYPPPPKAATATGPAVTLQAAPLGQLLDELKSLIRSIAGPFADMALMEMDKQIEKQFNKFDGFDLKKPLAGYVLLKEKPEDAGIVLVLPITDEAKFLASISAGNDKATSVAGNKGLYKYDSDQHPAAMLTLIRCHDGHAYISINVTEKELDVTALVTPDKLIDPKEKSQFAGRSSVDKIPPALVKHVHKELVDGLDSWKKDAEKSGPNAVKAVTAVDSLVRRNWTAVTQEGDALGAKWQFDTKAGTLVQDYTLTGKAGSHLAKDIAAWEKPKGNRFSGWAQDKDAALAGFLKLPLFVPEIQDLAAVGLAELEKTGKDQLPEVAHAVLTELIAGLNRTAKTSDADVAVKLTGPDAAGTFTGIAAVSFADATKLETEIKALVKAIAPKEIKDAISWDVAKVGTVNLHEMKIADLLPAEAKKVFGDKAVLVIGFGPDAVFAGIGPDARAKVTAAVTLKPISPGTGPTVLLDTGYNPSRIQKLIKAINEQAGGRMETMLGNDDAMVPFLRTAVAGGAQLTISQTINIRLYGGVFFFGFRGGQP